MNGKMTLALPIAFALGMLVLPAHASAATLDFTLSSPATVTGLSSVVSFTATVSAPLTNSGDVFLNADSVNIDYPLTLDDSGFFMNFPLSLAPGDSFTGRIFTVTVPDFAQLYVAYNGYFEIDGGANSGAMDPIATANFTVTAVPEPATGLLLTGGLVLALRRRRGWGHPAAGDNPEHREPTNPQGRLNVSP
jgi:hypothetical protein